MTKNQRKVVAVVGERELRKLRSRIIDNRNRVDQILRKYYKRQLFKVRPQDEIRLLKLAQWSETYAVDLRYILDTILPYWYQKLAKYTRSRHGLGVGVASLTGKFSLRLLQDQIKKDYPDGEQYQAKKFRRQMQLIRKRKKAAAVDDSNIDMPVAVVRKGPLDFDTLDGYVTAYRKRIAKKRTELDSALAGKKNKRRKYRTSPWF